jgi:hypothetical protein
MTLLVLLLGDTAGFPQSRQRAPGNPLRFRGRIPGVQQDARRKDGTGVADTGRTVRVRKASLPCSTCLRGGSLRVAVEETCAGGTYKGGVRRPSVGAGLMRSQGVALERIVETIYQRRTMIRDLISSFRTSSRSPFPNWTGN